MSFIERNQIFTEKERVSERFEKVGGILRDRLRDCEEEGQELKYCAGLTVRDRKRCRKRGRGIME